MCALGIVVKNTQEPRTTTTSEEMQDNSCSSLFQKHDPVTSIQSGFCSSYTNETSCLPVPVNCDISNFDD